MPLTRFSADAFGVLTICLVALLILIGLLCIVYSFYFRSRIHNHNQEFSKLSFFAGPWIIRITFIVFLIWWGIGEIVRLTWLRQEGQILNFNPKWQETVCKCYIVSNLGFAEPCLFLTLLFLLRAPLQKMESGILSPNWNGKTAGFVLLYCFPFFFLQLFLILIGPELSRSESLRKIPHYFTRSSTLRKSDNIALCTYPLMNTILHGIFASVLTGYLFWLARRILKRVINKNLQKRVYTLIISVSSFFPLRVLFLGFSVISKPDYLQFEALSFSAFLALLCCAGVCIFMLVYCPVADSLALGNLNDVESLRVTGVEQHDVVSLIANPSHCEETGMSTPGRNSDASTKRGSISFRAFGKEGSSSRGNFVELSLFSPSSPPGSPPHIGWPMNSPLHLRGM